MAQITCQSGKKAAVTCWWSSLADDGSVSFVLFQSLLLPCIIIDHCFFEQQLTKCEQGMRKYGAPQLLSFGFKLIQHCVALSFFLFYFVFSFILFSTL